VKLSASPRGEAFKVIDEEELIEVHHRLGGSYSPLARGITYAEAGLMDDAERGLQTQLGRQPRDKQAKECGSKEFDPGVTNATRLAARWAWE